MSTIPWIRSFPDPLTSEPVAQIIELSGPLAVGTLTRLAGWPLNRGASAITDAADVVSVTRRHEPEYEVRIQNISRSAPQFPPFTAFVNHVSRGGRFEFGMDRLKIYQTWLTADANRNDVAISVGEVSFIEAGDLLTLQRYQDPTIREVVRVASALGVTINLADYPLQHDFPQESDVAIMDYWNDCKALIPTVTMRERDAGRGTTFDFSMSFYARTTRVP